MKILLILKQKIQEKSKKNILASDFLLSNEMNVCLLSVARFERNWFGDNTFCGTSNNISIVFFAEIET